jgi:hypothetical protein
MEFRAVRADLEAPSLEITTGPLAWGGEPGRVLSARVSSFVREKGLIAGINATPFSPVGSKEGVELSVTGLVVSGGTLISPPNPRYDAIVFYRDKRAALVRQADLGAEDAGGILQALGGFWIVLEGGEIPPHIGPASRSQALREARFPRSAVGLSRDGSSLFLLAIDGRRPGSVGATEAELGRLLKALGAWEGLSLDGGGSTALALRYPGGRVRTVNTPVHGGLPGRERAVAGCLGLRERRAGS